MLVFTSRHMDRAKLSNKIYSNVGQTTAKNFIHMVSTNMIKNCPISVADTRNNENIYGPLMASLKGKSTSIKPRPEINDDIQTPIEIYKTIQKLSYALM